MDHSEPSKIRNISSSAPAAPGEQTSDPDAPRGRVTDSSAAIELGQRLRARDPAALAELYREHRRRAFGLAYRVLGDGAAAEDAVHAAFLALWEQADRVDPRGGRLESLLMTIVHRRAVDLARRRARDDRHRASGHDPQDSPSRSVDAIPDEAAIELFERILDDGVEIQSRLTEALRALPPEQREVIELAYFDGLTHSVIAERLGLPSGTVKSRMRLGLKRLRSVLGISERGGKKKGGAP